MSVLGSVACDDAGVSLFLAGQSVLSQSNLNFLMPLIYEFGVNKYNSYIAV
jgi:hypothetical protein